MMPVKSRFQHVVATDVGLRRTNNEDRWYVDAERGIYAVIDGVGGHAAGEEAAGCAVEVLRERLSRQTGTPEERLREAIALANNEIFERAKSRPEWAGMACVLTVALVEDDIVTVGHVGDSRLYLLRPGRIEKKTCDHSPVGEREDRGELTEEDAMRHSRRNEIYRDVGSSERGPDDPGFIQIVRFPMPPDGALLLCSDGLTDQITSGEIRACVERYAPDFDDAVRSLIDAANAAGGKDNVTIVFVAGAEYGAFFEHENAARPAGDRAQAVLSKSFPIAPVAIAVIAGFTIGAAVMFFWRSFAPAAPRTIVSGGSGIEAALSQAHAGDTILIPDGKYREHLHLREGVNLRAQHPGGVTLIASGSEPAILARRIESGSVSGIWIEGEPASQSGPGILIDNASPAISDCKITGAATGIEIRGSSSPVISANQIVNNLGAGVEISGAATPRLTANIIAANGAGKPGPAKPGIEVHDPAKPQFTDNAIIQNAADPVWVFGRAWQPASYEENFYGNAAVKHVRLIDSTTPDAKPSPAGGSGVHRP